MFIDRCDVHCIHGDSVQEVQAAMLASEEFAAMADSFKLLGQPTRLRILYALSRRVLCVCDIASILEASQTAVSHQLRLLRNGRLVKVRRDGQMLYYSLADDHIRSLITMAVDHARED